MILVKDKIEGIVVAVEIDENCDHHTWAGCPVISTDGYHRMFEAVDVLTVVKAVKTSETVDEFISKIEDTWGKETIAEPIIKELHAKAVDKVFDEVVKVLDYSFTDDNKDLWEFGRNHNSALYRGLNSYANDYNGNFDKLDKDEQVRYLVQSALADC